MHVLYQFGLYLYTMVLAMAALFNTKAKKLVRGQKESLAYIRSNFEKNDCQVLWMHCASLGEFEQGRPVLEAIKKRLPKLRIVLTFYSPSGYEIRKNYALADLVAYLPLDTQRNARAFVNYIEPNLALFVKYEFWHQHYAALHEKEIPIISFSTILRPKQVYFKWYGAFSRKTLQLVEHYFAQNEETIKLLNSINCDQCTLSGDTRFDRVVSLAESVEGNELIDSYTIGKEVWIIGSAWPDDIECLNSIIDASDENTCFIIAPHEVERAKIDAMRRQLNKPSTLFSDIKTEDDCNISDNVLIIDSIGLLSSLYKSADYVYVGGAFGKGLHNTLEAAVFGMPIFIGPTYDKFQEARDLVEAGGIIPVSSGNELISRYKKFKSDRLFYERTSAINASYVRENVGATAKIVDYCLNLL